MIHPSVRIDPDVFIDCTDLTIGAGSVIRKGVEIYGRKITLGRETFLDEYTVIGGGSAYSATAELVCGDFCTMGMFSQLNIGCGLYMGDEVGIGIQVRVFTHGAWLSEWDGFPCAFASTRIGSRVWIPEGMVMAGASIGDDVVIGAGSVVRGVIPSGCFAAGTPAKVLAEDAYPRVLSFERKTVILERICKEAGVGMVFDADTIDCGHATFDVNERTISGKVTDDTERLRDQLRRHGIRFRYSPADGHYEPWGAP